MRCSSIGVALAVSVPLGLVATSPLEDEPDV
jgi:hypothetical protein